MQGKISKSKFGTSMLHPAMGLDFRAGDSSSQVTDNSSLNPTCPSDDTEQVLNLDHQLRAVTSGGAGFTPVPVPTEPVNILTALDGHTARSQ